MKHAIIILSHGHIEQLISLVKYFDDDFIVLIHLDKKNKYNSKHKEILSKINNVYIYSEFKTNWGGHNLLKCELFMLNEALKNKDIDYCHFISAQDVPTRNLGDFKNFFSFNKGLSFFKYKSYNQNEVFERFNLFRLNDLFDERTKTGRFFSKMIINIQEIIGIKRPIPGHFTVIFGGSAWFSLSRSGVEYLIDYTRTNPQFYKRLKYTFASDEIYINTVLLNSSYKEKIIHNDLRFVSWQFKNGSIPAILDKEDLFCILSTKNFFARKIDFSISSELLEHLNRNLQLEVIRKSEISSTGFWITNCFYDYPFDKDLSDALCTVLKLMKVQSVVDVGCGSGMYVNELLDCGFQAMGIDGNPYLKKMSNVIRDKCQGQFICADITQDLTVDVQFDAVISIDVGICLPKEYRIKYLNNLLRLTTKYIIIRWGTKKSSCNNSNGSPSFDFVDFEMNKGGAYRNAFCSEYLNHVVNSEESPNIFSVFEKHEIIVSSR